MNASSHDADAGRQDTTSGVSQPAGDGDAEHIIVFAFYNLGMQNGEVSCHGLSSHVEKQLPSRLNCSFVCTRCTLFGAEQRDLCHGVHGHPPMHVTYPHLCWMCWRNPAFPAPNFADTSSGEGHDHEEHKAWKQKMRRLERLL